MLQMLLILAAVAAAPMAGLPDDPRASATMEKVKSRQQFEATASAIFDRAMPMLECAHEKLITNRQGGGVGKEAALRQLKSAFADAGRRCGYAEQHAYASARIKTDFPDLTAAEVDMVASELLNSAIMATLI